MKTLTLVTVLIFWTSTVIAQIIHVPADQPTIQMGIIAASNGDTVLVDPGTYLENINFNGKNIIVASQFLFSSDTSHITNTIIDANNNGSVVTFEYGESSEALLSGFTLRNGNSTTSGGGIICVYSNPTLSYLIITDNYAQYNGGGIICGAFASPGLDNVALINNAAGNDGGGVYCYNNCNPSLTNVTITGNESYHGGGICCIEYCSVSMNNVHISGNTAIQGGGIFSVNNSNLFMTDVIINNNSATRGGGIYAVNSNFSCTENEFINNEADAHGGSVYYSLDNTETDQYEIELVNCTLDNNNAVQATGGMLISSSYANKSSLDISISGSFFTNNHANRRTCLYIDGEDITLRVSNTLFAYNKAETYVAGISNSYFCQGVFNNCLFYFNEAATAGGADNSGGAAVWSGASVDFINCTFTSNTAAYGSALTVGGGGIARSINCIYWGNSQSQIALDTYMNVGGNLSLSYCNVQGGMDSVQVSPESTLTWSEGNVNKDPCFVGSGEHDCQISDNSPCVDKGTPDTTGLNLPEYDLAGEFRIFNDRVDMGAYEWNTFVGIEESEMEALKSDAYCYPNPFPTSTTIECELAEPSTIQLTIYDYLGKQVELIKKKQAQGKQQIIWNAEGLPAGVYFCVIKSESGTQTMKMVKIK